MSGRRVGAGTSGSSPRTRGGGNGLQWFRGPARPQPRPSSVGCGGGPPCLPHSPRHPNTARDPATANPPPRLPNIARKTPPPLTCPIMAHKTPTANPPRFFNTAPKTPLTRHAASARHSRPCNHRPPRHPNTAHKTRRPERKTPPICHSRSHAESYVAAVAPNLRHTQVHHHHPAARKPRPNAMRSRHARPATTSHITPTRPRHRQPTSTSPAYAMSPRQGAPDDADSSPRRLTATLTHRHSDSPPRRPLNTVRKTTTAPTPPRRGPQHRQPGVDILY
ncbi:hypothetical protein EDB85DRAFT_1888132 [Lactarius pseudohatsudake]|nr:hypothetical protein EDB85DRAFT_1888132 [Lactarius pseudohatsudake]